MRLFSAQYVYTNSGPPLRRPLIATRDDGTIISVTDTGGDLPETATLAYYNGIIVPGFVNCHSHMELSWMKGLTEGGKGLAEFIKSIRKLREDSQNHATADTCTTAEAAAMKYDSLMASEGVVACADICNGTDSFAAKDNSDIDYISLIEVFGISPGRAGKSFEEAVAVAGEAEKKSLKYNITPHSAYAISLQLLEMIKNYKSGMAVSSIHFMESEDEALMLREEECELIRPYREILAEDGPPSLPRSHAEAVLNHVTSEGNLLLIHNTFADEETVRQVNKRGNTWWCLCPNSNLYITGSLPHVNMLRENRCNIVVGTDSLASNRKLSIIAELVTLQEAFPELSLEELIKWATLNGAEAIRADAWAGSIEPGKKPGLLLIEGADLSVPGLTRNSRIKRLI